jgi:hypothetical protein
MSSRDRVTRRTALKVIGAAGATIAAWAAQLVPEVALASSRSSKPQIAFTPLMSDEAAAGFRAIQSTSEVSALHGHLLGRGYAKSDGGTQGARVSGQYAGRFFIGTYGHPDGRTAMLMVAAPASSAVKSMVIEHRSNGPNNFQRRVFSAGEGGALIDEGTVNRSASVVTVYSARDGVTRVIDLNHLPPPSGPAALGIVQAQASGWGCAVCQFGFGALIGLPCFIGTAALCALACSVTAEVCAIPCGVIFWALCYVGSWAAAWDLCWWIGQCP